MRYQPERDEVPVEAVDRPRPLCSRVGAALLAAELDHWWHSRGYPQVRHTVVHTYYRSWRERRDAEEREGVWTVRSNLVNGLPPKQP
jgi:hypothetical protein